MRAVRCATALLVLGFLAWPATSWSAMQVETAPTPAEISLPLNGSATGVLLVRNPGSEPAKVTVAAAPSDPSVEITVAEPSSTVAAESSVALTFTVRRLAEGSGQRVVVRFVVTSEQRSRRTTVSSLTVVPAPMPALIDAKINSNVEAVNENRPGNGYVVLTNPRDTGVRVKEIEVRAPASMILTVVCPSGTEVSATNDVRRSAQGCEFDVGPREQLALPVRFAAGETVVPGPRSVAVRVTVTDPGTGSTASVLTTAGVVLEVYAESDLLKALGIPILLVVPGMIIVVTVWFLLRTFGPLRRTLREAQPSSGVTTVLGSTVLAVAVSLGMAPVYPLLTDAFVPGERRDYLAAYGFVDFYYVFGYSFAAAVLIWAVVAAGVGLHRGLLVPGAQDDATALLRKIGLRGIFGSDTSFIKVTVSADGLGGVVVADAGNGQVLVVPRIVVTTPGENHVQDEQNISGHDLLRLWWANRTSDAKAHFLGSDISAPRLADRDSLTTGQRVSLVRLE
ncbi:hypothetical protein [Lentzea sp. NPDC055074]